MALSTACMSWQSCHMYTTKEDVNSGADDRLAMVACQELRRKCTAPAARPPQAAAQARRRRRSSHTPPLRAQALTRTASPAAREYPEADSECCGLIAVSKHWHVSPQ